MLQITLRDGTTITVRDLPDSRRSVTVGSPVKWVRMHLNAEESLALSQALSPHPEEAARDEA